MVIWQARVQGYYEPFDAFPIFENIVSRKRLVIEQTHQYLNLATIDLLYTVVLTVNSRSVSGHSVHFEFFIGLCSLL